MRDISCEPFLSMGVALVHEIGLYHLNVSFTCHMVVQMKASKKYLLLVYYVLQN